MSMKFETIARIVMNERKGAFTAMEWQKELPVRANFKNTFKVTKVTKGVVRFGVQYDNIKNVQEKRENGVLPTQNAGLTWGEWSIYPYFIKHKGADYVRCSLSKNNPIVTQYFINGRPATKAECEAICTKAAFSSGEIPDIMTIKAENILKIG